jgi:D-alanine-D-alanine ligase-like ATP-grasp enzyme
MIKIAIIYQNELPPKRNGIQKPMKPGGYSDSGADIGYCLKENGFDVITPNDQPNPNNDYDWVFPDSNEGIQRAFKMGANIFWLNTVLYKNHPIEVHFNRDIEIVGQIPDQVEKYDDKILTNQVLKKNNLPIPTNIIIDKNQDWGKLLTNVKYPQVVKPIRGRGSQGVSVVYNQRELVLNLNALFENDQYGKSVYLEQFLPGQEITITIMPPGKYEVEKQDVIYEDYWSLPPVRRYNHEKGIAPYNGTVAVINNSEALSDIELENDKIKRIKHQCQFAAKLVNAKAPIRIDCRANDDGQYFLFDLNMKPNMTGASRSHRKNQDSLTMLASRKMGWSYFDLLKNILNQKWKPSSLSKKPTGISKC